LLIIFSFFVLLVGNRALPLAALVYAWMLMPPLKTAGSGADISG
jgi:hypothetical protein